MLSPFYDEEKEKELLNIIDKITQIIKDDGNNPEHYFARALQYYQLSQQYYDIFEEFDSIGNKELYFEYVNKAYDDVEKALSFNIPIDEYAYSFKLLMLKKLKKWEELIKYGMELDSEIGIIPEDRVLIGEAFFHLEEWQNCIDLYTTVINETNESEINRIGVDIFVERGIAYSELKQYELAVNDYKKHIELNKITALDKYNVYGLIADVYEELEDFDEAIKAHSEELKIYPDEPLIYFQRGRIYCDYLQEYDLAAEDFDNAIKYSDEDIYIYYHYCGYSYVHRGEMQERKDNQLALKYYDRAIEAYKTANKLEYADINSQDAKNSYETTVGWAIHCKEDLLKQIDSKNNCPEFEADTTVPQCKGDYSEYQDIIRILAIEEPDLYDLEAIKNDDEYNKLLNDSELISLNDKDAVNKIVIRISKLLDKHQKKRNALGCNYRPIDAIAYEIIEDWDVNISDAAKPYLRAMTQITYIDEMYGYDSADSIIRYFLINAKDYRGEKADKLKRELQDILDGNDSCEQMKLF